MSEPAVAACGVADGCVCLIEQLFFSRIGIEPVKILILIHTMFFTVVKGKDQPAVQESASAYSVDLVIPDHCHLAVIPAVGKHRVGEFRERGSFASPEDDPVIHQFISADVVLRIVDHLDLAGLLVEQEQRAAVSVYEPGSVEPERQLVADFVIRVVPDSLVLILPVFFA